MNTITRYRMMYCSSDMMPDSARASGTQAWHLIREVVEPESNTVVSFDPVAIFNFDSEATTFNRHLWMGGAVEIDPGTRESFELQKSNRARGVR